MSYRQRMRLCTWCCLLLLLLLLPPPLLLLLTHAHAHAITMHLQPLALLSA